MSPQEDLPDIPEIVHKIRKITLRRKCLPCYLQRMMKFRDILRDEFLLTQQQQKKVEFTTIFEAVENELRLEQYRVYREKHSDLTLGADERRLQTHLAEYVKDLIGKNMKNRLCYIITNDASYKNSYNGIKNALKLLIEALNARFDYELFLDSYQT